MLSVISKTLGTIALGSEWVQVKCLILKSRLGGKSTPQLSKVPELSSIHKITLASHLLCKIINAMNACPLRYVLCLLSCIYLAVQLASIREAWHSASTVYRADCTAFYLKSFGHRNYSCTVLYTLSLAIDIILIGT